MTKTVDINGKKTEVKIIYDKDQSEYVTENDIQMDIRGKMAVKAAIEKARICKKPIAKYDKVTKRAYLEYANGEKKYAD